MPSLMLGPLTCSTTAHIWCCPLTNKTHTLCLPLQAGVSATVVDARFCKPLDTDMLRRLAKEHPVMITVEEGSIGGFAAHVMQVWCLPACLMPACSNWCLIWHCGLANRGRIALAECVVLYTVVLACGCAAMRALLACYAVPVP